MVERVPGEFAPAQFRQEASRPVCAHRVVPHGERADLPPAQRGGEQRGRAGRRFVPGAVVGGQILVEEGAQTTPCRQLARLPGFPQPRGPVGLRGQERPVRERVGCRGARGPGDLPRLGQRPARSGQGETRPPERGEDREVRAGTGLHGPRFVQQRGGEGDRLETIVAERLLERRVDPPLGAAVASVPEDRIDAGLGDHLGDHPLGGPSSQHERGAVLSDPLTEFGEGVVQPPARGPTQGTHAGRFLVQYVEEDDGLAAIHSRAQSGVVGEPEVVAEPDEGCRAHAGIVGPRRARAQPVAPMAPGVVARPAASRARLAE